ncbi:uncharacterized protein K460DRAFT_405861 [Cucurbitaria berberidis CBS 394.84]|uniref:Probable double zinc ribbon domain-containing protein n=1 Tax=Cucurbitaria berberidis CBS 394.84 TaxID=1168544 RepID=A0A9P4GHA6_9PLEO|nr:uncharacterized protein K460DRAFT_405861 [Cucurbitaria berberidis CBS 394.84]KAF1845612.1 hypothetical protein K460DRAFT_405861 [Cucurbitaria berberidis CBS 394.84]
MSHVPQNVRENLPFLSHNPTQNNHHITIYDLKMINIIQKVLSKLDTPHPASANHDVQFRLRHQLQQLKNETLLMVAENPSSYPSDQISGTWSCDKCSHTNHIVVLPGEHPLGYLVCGGCSHILCSTCITSKIIEPWFNSGSDLRKDHGRGESTTDLPIAHAFEHADMVHWCWIQKCVCGARSRSWKKWAAYLISGGKASPAYHQAYACTEPFRCTGGL